MHAGAPELVAQLPAVATLALVLEQTEDYRYWYGRLSVPWHIPLPTDVNPARLPPAWVTRHGQQLWLVAHDLIVAFPSDSPPLTNDQTNVGVGVAAVIDPTLVQAQTMDPSKVIYTGGFSGDVTLEPSTPS